MKNEIKSLLKRFWRVGAISPGGIHNTKSVVKSRQLLLDRLSSSDGLECLRNVSRLEYAANMANLARLISGLLAMYDEDDFESIEFCSHYRSLITISESVDPLNWLLQQGVKIPRVNRELYDSVIREYDFEVEGGGTFYINTAEYWKPLLTWKIGEVHILYRSNFDNLGDILKLILYRSLPYLLFEESFRFTKLKTLAYKTSILERFTGFRPIEQAKNFKYIIEDAYTDLIKLANVGQSSSITLRYERLKKAQAGFSNSYRQAFQSGFYKPFFSNYEYSQYTTMFQELLTGMVSFIPVIKGKVRNSREHIKDYYIFDQLDRERNSTKVQSEAIDREIINFYQYNRALSTYVHQVHPDLKLGLYNLMLHLKLTNSLELYGPGSPLVQVISLIIGKYYRRKPVLVKFLIKDILDSIYHDFKEDGLLMFHQLETIFGYRNSHLIIDEVKEDYLAWFNEDIAKYSNIQKEFIHKWAPSFFEYRNYKGEKIGSIYMRNLKKFDSFQEMLGNPSTYMTSTGAVDDFKAVCEDGSTRGISKNQYFNIFKSQSEYIESLKSKVTPRRNKVIIKREEAIKQRIVINSTLNTFVPLSKLNRFVSRITKGSGITYFSNSKPQKADHYYRLEDYLLYNKYVNNRFLALPLDYSSYDHTITMGFIEGVLEELADYVGYGSEVRELIKEFQTYLKDEVTYFKELEGLSCNNQKYKYGMFSGWKITSSVESLGNAIISYGISQELREVLTDFETMGDDLILIYDKPSLNREKQLEFLDLICNKYQELGFKMNAPKNSVGYYFLEFLRVTFLPGLVQSYPARVLGAVSTLKPGRSNDTFGITEFQSVCKKIVKRYGVTSQYILFAEGVAKHYKKSDIREYGVRYLKNPNNYEILRRDRLDYKIKISRSVETIPAYKRYLGILGDQYGEYIKRVCEREILQKVVTVTKVVPLKKKRGPPEKWKIDVISRIFSLFWKDIQVWKHRVSKLIVPDYHLCSIILEYFSREKLSVKAMITELFRINESLLEHKIVTRDEYNVNNDVILLSEEKSVLFDILREDKVKVDENIIPAIILSQVKKSLIQNIKNALVTLNLKPNELAYLRAILRKKCESEVQTILSTLLSEASEVVDRYSGLPIAFRSD